MATESSAQGAGLVKTQSNPRFLFRQPLALQWREGDNVLKRSEGERQAGRFELFLDLLYVAILANFAENLAEHPTGVQLVKYILILAPSWHIWSDLRELMNSFYNDDLAQRVLILWIMAILVVYGNNAVHVDEDIGAMRATVGAYLVARFSSNLTHLIYSFASYHHRVQQRLWFVLASMALCLYIPLFIEDLSFRSKIAVAATAIAVEESIWIFCYSPLAMRLTKAVYTTAVDIPHEVDRFAAFFIIVLGEYLYQIIVGSPAAGGFNIPLLRAIWTLIIAFSLNWLYIHNDGAMEGSHPLKHNIFASFAWVTLHLPMTACLLVAGHVSARSSQEEEIHGGELWLLCGGLGAGLICLFIIAMLHQSHDEPGVLMLPKGARLILRPIVGIIIICLPLDHHLHTTELLSIIMALVVLCVIWESVTSLMRGARFWQRWENTKYPERHETPSERSSETWLATGTNAVPGNGADNPVKRTPQAAEV